MLEKTHAGNKGTNKKIKKNLETQSRDKAVYTHGVPEKGADRNLQPGGIYGVKKPPSSECLTKPAEGQTAEGRT